MNNSQLAKQYGMAADSAEQKAAQTSGPVREKYLTEAKGFRVRASQMAMDNAERDMLEDELEKAKLALKNAKTSDAQKKAQEQVSYIKRLLLVAGDQAMDASFDGYVVTRIGPYKILQGIGRYGGSYAAQGRGETVVFTSRKEAEEHATLSAGDQAMDALVSSSDPWKSRVVYYAVHPQNNSKQSKFIRFFSTVEEGEAYAAKIRADKYFTEVVVTNRGGDQAMDAVGMEEWADQQKDSDLLRQLKEIVRSLKVTKGFEKEPESLRSRARMASKADGIISIGKGPEFRRKAINFLEEWES